ncbi:MAG: hypothetical protein ACTSUD_11510 [Alphaproteobacteria bacterium]
MNAPLLKAAGAPTDKAALARLLYWLAGVFGLGPNRARARAPEIDPRFDAEAIEKLLVAIREQRVETSDGSIQMVHFGALPQAIGRRWAGYVERAMHLSESMLLKRLGPDDFFTRYADFAFIVVFADTEDHAAPRHAEALSEDIQHRLLLDRELAGQIAIREVIARIIDLLGDKTPPKIRKLALALANNAKLKNKEAAKANPEKKTAAAKLDLAEARTKPAKPKAKAKDKPNGEFKTLVAHPADGEQAALPDWMGNLSAVFRPMLHVNNRVVGIHAGFPRRITPDGEELVGEAAYPKGAAGDLTTTIDLLLARHILDELRLAVGAGNKTQISTMATLNSLATSRELGNLILGLDDKQSKQFIIEIAGVRPSTPMGQLSEAVGKVRSTHILARLLDTKFKPFADAGLTAVGCNVSAPDLRSLKAEVIAGAMAKFVENAKAAKLGAYFHGVDSDYLRNAAGKSGVDYITGDAFEPGIGRPGTPRMLKS